MPDAAPLALITGASGGLGLEMARILARQGYRLVLTARSEGALAEAAQEAERLGSPEARAVALDLSDDDAAPRLVAALDGVVPDVLINNAGFGAHGPFEGIGAEETHRMVTLNVTALTDLTRALLPGMRARGRGQILNVASTASFQPGPFMATYYATKAYVLSLSEALHDELRGTGVTVTCLCPGPTQTGFADRAGIAKLYVGRMNTLMPDARTVSEAGIRAMQRGERLVIPGLANRLGTLGARVLPRGVVLRMIRRIQDGRG